MDATLVTVVQRPRDPATDPTIMFEVISKPARELAIGMEVALFDEEGEYLNICRRIEDARLPDTLPAEFILKQRGNREAPVAIGLPLQEGWCRVDDWVEAAHQLVRDRMTTPTPSRFDDDDDDDEPFDTSPPRPKTTGMWAGSQMPTEERHWE